MASYTELNLDQGSTFTTTLDLANDDGSPINLANTTFISQIRKSYYSSNPAANLSVTITDAANGVVLLELSAAQTANVKAGRYLFDLKMTANTGTTTRIVEGIITVQPQVSR